MATTVRTIHPDEVTNIVDVLSLEENSSYVLENQGLNPLSITERDSMPSATSDRGHVIPPGGLGYFSVGSDPIYVWRQGTTETNIVVTEQP